MTAVVLVWLFASAVAGVVWVGAHELGRRRGARDSVDARIDQVAALTRHPSRPRWTCLLCARTVDDPMTHSRAVHGLRVTGPEDDPQAMAAISELAERIRGAR